MKVGITGGIGSGKSEACRIFDRLGVPVLYADSIAKEVSASDPHVKKAIVALLGPEAYTQKDEFNRAYVASKVFASKSVQKKINAIVHPRVEEEIDRRIAQLETGGATVVLVEAALIFEAGLDRQLDAVVVVDAEEETKIARIIKRDGAAREAILERMKAQLTPAAKLRKADYIIYNNGTLEELEANVKFLHSVFQSVAHSMP
jgi:dephospho-CoA kinase